MNSWAELIKAVAEILRGIAWPISFGFVFWILRPGLLKVLPSLADRKVEVEGLGFKATIDASEAEQQQAVTDNPASEKLPAAVPLPSNERPALNRMEMRLRDDLKHIDPDKRENVLLQSLARTRLDGVHEFMYNRIFGSQIAFLRRLNEIPQITIEGAREFLKPFQTKFPQIYQTYDFEKWLNFLTTNGLVKQTGNVLVITDFAHDFLIYITQRRLTDNKAF